jgi:hypothetical protein
MGEGDDRRLTVITGDRKTRERRAGRRRALDQNEQIASDGVKDFLPYSSPKRPPPPMRPRAVSRSFPCGVS